MRFGAVVTGSELNAGLVKDEFDRYVGQKARDYGCTYVRKIIGPDEPVWIAAALRELVDLGCELIIFGAGHVGTALAEIAKLPAFQVTVVDNRPEFARSRRLPWADQVVAEARPGAFNPHPGSHRVPKIRDQVSLKRLDKPAAAITLV